MHEIVEFGSPSKNQIPDPFLRHLKINFTLKNVKSEEIKPHGKHSRVELAHIEIRTIELVDAEYLIVTYKERLFFDIFNLQGVQIMRKHLLNTYPSIGIEINTLDKVIIKRSSNPIQKRKMDSKIIVFGTAFKVPSVSPNTGHMRFKEGVGFQEDSESPDR